MKSMQYCSMKKKIIIKYLSVASVPSVPRKETEKVKKISTIVMKGQNLKSLTIAYSILPFPSQIYSSGIQLQSAQLCYLP
jgi:DNA phosphorothioation-dependent restriction protein DptG